MYFIVFHLPGHFRTFEHWSVELVYIYISPLRIVISMSFKQDPSLEFGSIMIFLEFPSSLDMSTHFYQHSCVC
jgi:hypothetical protein